RFRYAHQAAEKPFHLFPGPSGIRCRIASPRIYPRCEALYRRRKRHLSRAARCLFRPGHAAKARRLARSGAQEKGARLFHRAHTSLAGASNQQCMALAIDNYFPELAQISRRGKSQDKRQEICFYDIDGFLLKEPIVSTAETYVEEIRS